MPPFGKPVVMDEFGICPLRPAPRGFIELVWKDAHSNWDGDTLGREELQLAFPIEARRGDSGIRQPVERDVVQNILLRDAIGMPLKGARDERFTLLVMIKHPRCQPHG